MMTAQQIAELAQDCGVTGTPEALEQFAQAVNNPATGEALYELYCNSLHGQSLSFTQWDELTVAHQDAWKIAADGHRANAPMPDPIKLITLWQPIETAPKDNAKPLYLARLDADGKLLEIDFDGMWQSERESWEMPTVYYYWASAKGIEEPTHWAYQIGSPPVEL